MSAPKRQSMKKIYTCPVIINYHQSLMFVHVDIITQVEKVATSSRVSKSKANLKSAVVGSWVKG